VSISASRTLTAQWSGTRAKGRAPLIAGKQRETIWEWMIQKKKLDRYEREILGAYEKGGRRVPQPERWASE
jgi:hypothetical protein